MKKFRVEHPQRRPRVIKKIQKMLILVFEVIVQPSKHTHLKLELLFFCFLAHCAFFLCNQKSCCSRTCGVTSFCTYIILRPFLLYFLYEIESKFCIKYYFNIKIRSHIMKIYEFNVCFPFKWTNRHLRCRNWLVYDLVLSVVVFWFDCNTFKIFDIFLMIRHYY